MDRPRDTLASPTVVAGGGRPTRGQAVHAPSSPPRGQAVHAPPSPPSC